MYHPVQKSLSSAFTFSTCSCDFFLPKFGWRHLGLLVPSAPSFLPRLILIPSSMGEGAQRDWEAQGFKGTPSANLGCLLFQPALPLCY